MLYNFYIQDTARTPSLKPQWVPKLGVLCVLYMPEAGGAHYADIITKNSRI